MPTRRGLLNRGQFVQAMRLRVGVACVLPADTWKCNCRPRNCQPQDAAIDGNLAAVGTGQRFSREPCHGLVCRRRYERVMWRHDAIRDRLIATFNRIDGLAATREPNVGDPAHPQRRADICVTKNGTKWMLDVGVVCPATHSMVSGKATDKYPGRAAQIYAAKKKQTYVHVQNFVPFVVETGGRLHKDATDFVCRIIDDGVEDYKMERRRVFQCVAQALERQHAYMLSQLVKELHDDRRARDLAHGGQQPQHRHQHRRRPQRRQ